MTFGLPILLVVMAVGVAESNAQHSEYQVPGVTAAAPPNPACVDAARRTLAIVEAAGTESTLVELQRAAGAAQAELFTCRAAVPTTSPTTAPAARRAAAPMAGMDYSRMAMGKSAPAATSAKPGTKPADPMAGMDHSKVARGKAAPAAAPRKPSAKPADPMPGMDHSKMTMGKPVPDAIPGKPGVDTATAPGTGKLPVTMAERLADPACPDNVGQATAPKAVYERKVYYFCSTKTRDQFRKDPAAYLKKHPR